MKQKCEQKILFPLKTHSPALLEPKNSAISSDASKVYVTLQEDAGVAVVYLIKEQLIRYLGDQLLWTRCQST